MKTKTKKRIPVWMENDLLETIEKLMPADKSKNRSEFICNAVSFYTGFLQAKDIEAYTTKTLLKSMDSQLALHQKNICRTLYKLAVELNMNTHIVAESYENITPAYMEKLRQRCAGEVKKSLGTINFESIYEYHNPQDTSSEDEE